MSNHSSISLLHRDFDLKQFIHQALKEDIQTGDYTSLCTIPVGTKNRANLIIKQNGILSGVTLATKIFFTVDKELKLTIYKKDGSRVKKGDIAFTVYGNARSILAAERVVLNCMQRMSGISTKTDRFIKLCKPYNVKLLDTRKTTPGIRGLEKWAVRIGGGYNHRFGLYDMILIKNNHIDFAGGIQKAIASAVRYVAAKKMKLQIEIEARNIREVQEILSAEKVHRILLDNFSLTEIKKAVALIDGKIETEVSGGVTEKNISKYAACGVNYISTGAITHSAKSMDMSLTATKSLT